MRHIIGGTSRPQQWHEACSLLQPLSVSCLTIMHHGRTLRSTAWKTATAHSHLLVLCVILLALFGLQARFLAQAAFPISDEAVHALVGRWILRGILPYRDFAYSHPPLLGLLMNVALPVTPSLLPPRLLYLAANLTAAVPLYLTLRKLTDNALAALTGALFYVTYHQMVDHNFRFIALRQVANVFLIWYLYAGVVRRKGLARSAVQTVLALCSVFTFLPSAANIAFVSIAMIAGEKTWTARGRSLARYAIMGGAVLAALAAFFLLVPDSFRAIVLDQMDRPLVGRIARFWWTAESRRDLFLYCATLAGLVLGLAFAPRLRLYCLAGLGTIGLVFLPRAFFPHYFDIAGPACAIGVCALAHVCMRALRRLPAFVPMLIPVLLLIAHWSFSLRPMLDEWNNNKDVPYYQSLELLRTLPDPVLTFFEPAFALEAGKQFVYGPQQADFRTYGSLLGKQLSREEYDDLAARACTIFLIPWDTGYIPQEVQADWRARFEEVPFQYWATVLKTGHPFCLDPLPDAQ